MQSMMAAVRFGDESLLEVGYIGGDTLYSLWLMDQQSAVLLGGLGLFSSGVDVVVV